MNLGAPIGIGNTAKIYLYEDKVIKVFNDYLPDTESENEAFKQKYAYSCGLNVPKIWDVTKIDGKQVIIMDYINGRTLGELSFANIEKAEYYMEISVNIQQKIHMVIADNFEPMPEKLTSQIKSNQILNKRLKHALIEKLHTMPFEKMLCHGDFHLFNLIMSDNKVSIIDWVDSSAGDIRADIYRTYLLYSQFSRDLANMYLRLYCEKSGLSKDEIFEWAPIIAGARLSENISSEESRQLLEIINHHYPI